MELTAKVHQEDGSYWAEVEQLPGCFASGSTLDELLEALRESVQMCVDDGSPDPKGPGTPLRINGIRLTA